MELKISEKERQELLNLLKQTESEKEKAKAICEQKRVNKEEDKKAFEEKLSRMTPDEKANYIFAKLKKGYSAIIEVAIKENMHDPDMFEFISFTGQPLKVESGRTDIKAQSRRMNLLHKKAPLIFHERGRFFRKVILSQILSLPRILPNGSVSRNRPGKSLSSNTSSPFPRDGGR